MSMQTEFVTSKNPSVSAVYMVDRGFLGKWFRHYDAEKDHWGRITDSLDRAIEGKDAPQLIEFLPWKGPVKKAVVDEVVETAEPEVTVKKVTKAAVTKKADKQSVPVFEDGTVFYRGDRNKWVAIWNGKQEAARDTVEACLKYLKKKYNFEGVVTK